MIRFILGITITLSSFVITLLAVTLNWIDIHNILYFFLLGISLIWLGMIIIKYSFDERR